MFARVTLHMCTCVAFRGNFVKGWRHQLLNTTCWNVKGVSIKAVGWFYGQPPATIFQLGNWLQMMVHCNMLQGNSTSRQNDKLQTHVQIWVWSFFGPHNGGLKPPNMGILKTDTPILIHEVAHRETAGRFGQDALEAWLGTRSLFCWAQV